MVFFLIQLGFARNLLYDISGGKVKAVFGIIAKLFNHQQTVIFTP